MTNRDYYNPVKIIRTTEWVDKCKETIEALDIQSPLIMATKGGFERSGIDSIFPFYLTYAS